MSDVRDSTDNVLDEWAQQLPDIDLSGRQVIWRIDVLARHLDQQIAREIDRFGLGSTEFKLLLALLRQGPPHESAPTDLARNLMLTSGTMTNLLDRLETAGLVSRAPDPRDGRGVRVRLTDQGRTVIEAAHAAYLTREQALLSMLSPEERETLAALLRKVLLPLEASAPYKPRRARPPLKPT
jgi:DNA-binding MarR family transcriptional regulator